MQESLQVKLIWGAFAPAISCAFSSEKRNAQRRAYLAPSPLASRAAHSPITTPVKKKPADVSNWHAAQGQKSTQFVLAADTQVSGRLQ